MPEFAKGYDMICPLCHAEMVPSSPKQGEASRWKCPGVGCSVETAIMISNKPQPQPEATF